MEYDYIIRTSIPRNFDPEVEGVTLDSIAHSCPGYVNHTIPIVPYKSEIHMTLDRPIDGEPREWMVGQLQSEFGFDGVVVSGIDRIKG